MESIDISMQLIGYRDTIPIIDYKNHKYLNEFERKLSKFFKCSNYGQKCSFVSNTYTTFRKHVRNHNKLYCFYCYHEKRDSGGLYYVSDLDSFLTHILSVHGFHSFQCNLCAYRAYTTIHVQMHQLMAHRKCVDAINHTKLTVIDETNKDIKSTICKIIKCKNILYGPVVHYSLYFNELTLPKYINKGYYCLFCGFYGQVLTAVYIHFVKNHCDREISVWHNLNKNSNFELAYTGSKNKSKLFDDVETEYVNNDDNVSIKSEKKGIPGLEFDFKPPKGWDHQRSKLHSKRYFDTNNTRRTNPFDPTIRRPTHSSKRETNISDCVSDTHSLDERPLPPHIVLSQTEFSGFNTEQRQATNKEQNKPNIVKKATKTTTFTKVSADKTSSEQNTTNKTGKFKIPNSKIMQRMKKRERLLALDNEKMSERELEKVPKRGIKARFENRNFFDPLAIGKIGSNSLKERNLFRCVICNIDDLRENKIAQHLQLKHNTKSSFRCGHCRDFVNEKNEIREHIRLKHPNSNEKIEKFIVPSYQHNPITVTPSAAISRPPPESNASFVRPAVNRNFSYSSTAKKRTFASKGSLMQQIKESTFLGPLKNDVTNRRINLENDVNSDNIDDTPVPIPDKPKRKIKLKPSQVSKKSTAKRGRNLSDSQTSLNSLSGTSNNNANVNTLKIETKLSSCAIECETEVKSVIKEECDVKVKLEINDQYSNIVAKIEPVSQYFCIFCTDNELKVLNNKKEAIEHYKAHLNLGYYCGLCDALVTTYDHLSAHYALNHPTVSDISQREHMPQSMRTWILEFLDNQVSGSLLVHNRKKNPNCLNIDCPVCEKAAILIHAEAKYFKSLWEARMHLIKHFAWYPMYCTLCAGDQSVNHFPDDGYLLMHHLANNHKDSNEKIFYYSFRGHKPFYDLNPHQIATIEDNYNKNCVESSEILDALFKQLISKLTVKYENDMKWRHRIRRDVTIKVERMPDIKAEPMDNEFDTNEQNTANFDNDDENNKYVDNDDECVIVLDSDSEDDDAFDSKNSVYSKLLHHQNALISSENGTKVKTEPEESITLSSDDE